jgi:two-component system sensor histidine kinase KdpD
VQASVDLSPAAAAGRGVGRARRISGVVLAVVALPVGTAVLVRVHEGPALASVLLLYVLAVVVIAAVGGAVAGVLAAALSFGLALWYFIPPFHTLALQGRDRLVDMLVFAIVAAVVSASVEIAARDRAANQRELAEQAARTRELAAEDRVRSALLAAVGHDLRTPLANVKAAVGSLRQPDVTWSPREHDELLATIEESTDRLTNLVTNLLDMTRLRADALTVRLGPVALDEVVARALLVEHGAHVETDVPDDLPPALADPVLLERVVANLVENALRFTPAGERVRILGEPGPGEPGHRRAGEDGATVRLHVMDRGPGIPEQRREEVFAAFQRLDDRGAGSHVGLGLAICRGFTEAMGGEISPSTTEGGGLTMTITLPAAAR